MGKLFFLVPREGCSGSVHYTLLIEELRLAPKN